MKIINVPSRLWYDNEERELTFPDYWHVDNLTSTGFEKPGLTSEQIGERIQNPVGDLPLEEMARGKQQAVIVFDDMTRPTPVKAVAPHVLESLYRAGIRKDQIRFLWALGSHGAYDMIAARKKLGNDIVESYRIYNHDAFQNTVRVGRTPTGVELWLNKEFMDCDLKIGIGCITAHINVGFGGGAKLILPGVASIESINQFHNQSYRDPSRIGMGVFENNIMRAECDAAGDLAGLNFKIDCLINRRGEIVNLYAGPFRTTHALGAEEAREHYGISINKKYDIIISNAYGKANEAAIGLYMALPLLKSSDTGTAVLIADAPEGQVPHFVFRSFGVNHGGRHYMPRPKGFLSSFVKKVIILDPYPTPTCVDWLCHIDDVIIRKSWQEVLDILRQDYPSNADVGVIQDGTVQYIVGNSK